MCHICSAHPSLGASSCMSGLVSVSLSQAPSTSCGSWWPPGWFWGPLGHPGTCVSCPGVGDCGQVHLLPLCTCQAVVMVSAKWHPCDGRHHKWCVGCCGMSVPRLPTIASSGHNLWSPIHSICATHPICRDCTASNRPIGFQQPSAQLRRD